MPGAGRDIAAAGKAPWGAAPVGGPEAAPEAPARQSAGPFGGPRTGGIREREVRIMRRSRQPLKEGRRRRPPTDELTAANVPLCESSPPCAAGRLRTPRTLPGGGRRAFAVRPSTAARRLPRRTAGSPAPSPPPLRPPAGEGAGGGDQMTPHGHGRAARRAAKDVRHLSSLPGRGVGSGGGQSPCQLVFSCPGGRTLFGGCPVARGGDSRADACRPGMRTSASD